MAGHGISVGANPVKPYFCEEHGYIIGIMSIMPKTAYQQGLPRHFSKTDRFDYLWPDFARLGEQAVFNKEIYCFPDGLNDRVFGYVPRYQEYRFIPSSVHGEMRNTLNFWHLGRIFSNRPVLNEVFIKMVNDNRIFAIENPNVDTLIVHIYNRVPASI